MTLECLSLHLFSPRDTLDTLPEVLSLLEGSDLLAPAYWSFDERKRLPFEKSAALNAKGIGDLLLWDTHVSPYFAMIERSKRYLNRLFFLWEKRLSSHFAESIYEASTILAARLGFEYGVLHERWEGYKGHDHQYLRGCSMKSREIYHNGPPALGARTWFGPLLVERIGRERIEASGNVRPVGSGLQLDLVPEPWAADYETLLAAHNRAYAALSASGMFANTTTIPESPGPAWTKPDWKMKLTK